MSLEARLSATLSPLAPYMLSILRLVAGLLFLEHGLMKLVGFPAPMRVPVALFSLYGAAGTIETIGGLLVAIGLFTRPAAFIMSGEMAFAYFLEHFPHSFFPALNAGDAAVLFCFLYLYLVFAGGGAWSIDAMMATKKRGAPAF